ncbi:type II toxin-antitoxin system Phd/YefM family antitoxin [Acidobacteria bacterium AH-259-L09]|nr:type II toxin-antitoxin system Phd/YefM family antitoxin [Acidobacteria bacterium AH-259-L09]
MKNIVPISDLQAKASQIISDLEKSKDPVLITRRSRPAAVLISPEDYFRVVEDLERLDELELREMIQQGEKEATQRHVVSSAAVKNRLARQKQRS